MKKDIEIYGIRPIIEAINQNKPIYKIWMLKGQRSNLLKTLENKVHENGISYSYVPKERLDKLSNQNHQGAVAKVSPIQFESLEILVEQNINIKAIYILLDGITDTRNLGAIIRTAAAMSVSGIIIPKTGSAPINADTVKTSAGGIFSVPIVKVNHLKDAIYMLQSNNISILAVSEKATDIVFEYSFDKSVALVIGSEENGIQPSIMKLIEKKIKIPMNKNMKSLNVSVAFGIIVSEILRQRNYH